MPLMWGAAISGGSSLLSGVMGYFGAKGAADKQAQYGQQALDFQKQMYAEGKQNLAPYLQLGKFGADSVGKLYGMNGLGGGQADYSQFYNSPDYKFAFEQGNRATTNTLNAQGNLLSGGGLAALTNYGQGMASQQYGNYFNRLMAMTGVGANAAGQGLGFASNMAGAIGGTTQGIGSSLAGGIVGGTNALTGALGGVGNAANQYGQNNLLMNYINKNNSGGGNPFGGSAYNWGANPMGGGGGGNGAVSYTQGSNAWM